MKPPSPAMFIQPSIVSELVSLKLPLSGMLTRREVALKLKACPTSPVAYAIPKGVVPSFVPALSKALPSPRHQPTRPEGTGAQLVAAKEAEESSNNSNPLRPNEVQRLFQKPRFFIAFPLWRIA